MNEAEIIKRVQDGDQGAFKELVDSFKDMVFKVCYNFLRNTEEAEDITQEVFLTVYKNINRFKEKARLSTWIYRIAVNKSLNFIRKNRRVKIFSFFKKDKNSEDERETDLASPKTADEPLLSDERSMIIKRALGALPDNQRTSFTLHNIEGFTYEEIAGIMECSVSAVESRIHRAKTKLRKLLTKMYEET